MKKQELNTINFNEYPFKGILSEVAKEIGCSRMTVYRGLNVKSNKFIISAVRKKVNKRLKEVQFSEMEV